MSKSKNFATIMIPKDLKKELNNIKAQLQLESESSISYADVIRYLISCCKIYRLDKRVTEKVREIMLANNLKSINETVEFLIEAYHKPIEVRFTDEGETR